MSPLIQRVGSPQAALVGMALLAVGATLSYGNPQGTSIWVLVVPMGLLALSLVIAITTNPKIYNRPPLLLFHIGLLAMLLLAAYGRLTFFEAHLEIVSGSEFTPTELLRSRAGVWHRGDIDKVRFVQGSYTVAYSAGLVRGLTRSELFVPGADGQLE
ncbi:MAG: hypothetical protein FD130_1833, partial [Halothiobacillaceae bacterium]